MPGTTAKESIKWAHRALLFFNPSSFILILPGIFKVYSTMLVFREKLFPMLTS
jgi:hypothetical protein